MMKGFMGLTLDISTFSEGYRRNMSTCRYTHTLSAIPYLEIQMKNLNGGRVR